MTERSATNRGPQRREQVEAGLGRRRVLWREQPPDHPGCGSGGTARWATA
ncbi:hypothetical protein [Saccharothrix sp. Mg75]